VAARPPSAPIVALMSHAHGADIYRAWANAVVHGLFAPIPRTHAAGCAFLRGRGDGTRVAAVHGLDEIRRLLGPLIVEERLPAPGQARAASYEGDGWLIVKHAETAKVEQALAQIHATVRVDYSDSL
jgi:hypothetical protein